MMTRLLFSASISTLLSGCILGRTCADESYARYFDLVAFCVDGDGCDLADGVVVPAQADAATQPLFAAKLEIGEHRTVVFPLDSTRLAAYPKLVLAIDDGLPYGAADGAHLAFDGGPADCERSDHVGPEALYRCTPPAGARELSFDYSPSIGGSEPVHLTLRVYLQEEVETGSHEVCYV